MFCSPMVYSIWRKKPGPTGLLSVADSELVANRSPKKPMTFANGSVADSELVANRSRKQQQKIWRVLWCVLLGAL
jgi:hypothetical protein